MPQKTIHNAVCPYKLNTSVSGPVTITTFGECDPLCVAFRITKNGNTEYPACKLMGNNSKTRYKKPHSR